MGAAAAYVSHVPVLIGPIMAAASPVTGVWVDGTLGAGGYTRALLEAGAHTVISIDRDPDAIAMARDWASGFEGKIQIFQDNFSNLDRHVDDARGVVLDLGVSSMQLDQAERGFSFRHDGPLDMRMAQAGPSAADLVNRLPEAQLADLLYLYGEERASRRIARAIAKARTEAPLTTTRALARIIERVLPAPRPGQLHPATRSFQAIRIAVNDEFGALVRGLDAAERALAPEGLLAVVTFHSIEDRMVKRYLQIKTNATGRSNRYAPDSERPEPTFVQDNRKAIAPDAEELNANPRARSAKLRLARRTATAAAPVDRKLIGLPVFKGEI
ncbi:MAG: 16S rRNA (cytosine(1402)-N(4))-methyltransferase RsmH [Pseudomonadota bacterium]